jgi:hypothetical protein
MEFVTPVFSITVIKALPKNGNTKENFKVIRLSKLHQVAIRKKLGMVVHSCNPSTWKAEAEL